MAFIRVGPHLQPQPTGWTYLGFWLWLGTWVQAASGGYR